MTASPFGRVSKRGRAPFLTGVQRGFHNPLARVQGGEPCEERELYFIKPL